MKLLFASLGCDKNLVDSEYMIGMLTSHGIELTDDEKEADKLIVKSRRFIGVRLYRLRLIELPVIVNI